MEIQLQTEYANSIVPSNKVLITESYGLFQLKSYQMFIKNLMNYNTEFSRIMVNHETGTGKTITALNTATEFIKVFKKNNNMNEGEIGSIFILGFTKAIFKNELLSRVEYGIVNQQEIDELKDLQSIQEKNIEQVSYIKELQTKYSKRMKNRNGNGYYRFIGYKELFNKLLVIKNNIKIESLNESTILNYIKTGEIEINLSLLDLFKNSLVICDEIHNVWNSLEKNTWGISLQILFSYYNTSIKVLLLSATPLTNSPAEIISLINLLSKKEDYIKFKDVFSRGKITNIGKQLIINGIQGKLSYIQGRDVEQFPHKEIIGNYIKNIPQLKFIKCPMSKFHFETYKYESLENINIKPTKKLKDDNEIYTDEASLSESIKNEMEIFPINLSVYNRYLIDYALPNPNNEKYGLFKSNTLKEEYSSADSKWLSKNNIIPKFTEASMYLSGKFMLHENMKKYSTKYYKLYEYVKNIISNKEGKILIFHQYVSNSGILFIAEFFKINGFLDEYSAPVSDSRCSICFKQMKEHKSKEDHQYKALRFALAYGEVSQVNMNTTLLKYNSSNNKNGENIKILIGSRYIKEGFDLKCVRHLFVTHMPDNISILHQIFGRAVRTNSHAELPLSERTVKIYILVTSLPEELNNYSFEELLYKKKIEIYQDIQEIEDLLHKSAIDYNIQRNINIYENNLIESKQVIKSEIPIDISKLNNYSFNAYYISEEIEYIQYIIKKLFILVSPIFDYDYLFELISNPPFQVNRNHKIITEGLYLVALNNLLRLANNNIFINKNKISVRLTGPYKHNDKIFYYAKDIDSNTDFNNINSIKQIDKPMQINITNLISNSKIPFTIVNEVNNFIIENANLRAEQFETLNVLYNYNIVFQTALLEAIIMHSIKKIDNNLCSIVNKLIRYYNKYNILLYSNDCRIAKSELSQFKQTFNNRKLPIGYKLGNDKTIFLNNKFVIHVNNIPLPKYKNAKIYGIQVIESNMVKFKLLESNNTNKIKDLRFRETGSNCLFKSKSDLKKILTFLKISHGSLQTLQTKSICAEIDNKLLQKEIFQRTNNLDLKYYYTIGE